MRRYVRNTLLIGLALLAGCSTSNTVLVSVPPRMDLGRYGTLGIVAFASDAERGASVRATRQFQEQIQAAQPGTPFIELGEREAVLASVGARELDVAALRKIGEKYGVRAIFVGELAYSEPRMDVKLMDVAKLEGGVRAEMRGDISSRLLDTATGASVWSSSAWARRQIGSLHVSAEQGVSGGMSQSNPRDEMVPTLVHHLTQDFRPTSVRQRVQ
jgi:hypothetical protein